MTEKREPKVHLYRLGTQGQTAACGRRLKYGPPWPTYALKKVTCVDCQKTTPKQQGFSE